MEKSCRNVRLRSLIDNDVVFVGRWEQREPFTGRWSTVGWISCRKYLPVRHPDRWRKFLVRNPT